MKIAVIGATGRTGREVVAQALARGHEVVAVARSPERLHVSGAGAAGGFRDSVAGGSSNGMAGGVGNGVAGGAGAHVTAVAADAHDGEALRRAVDGSDAIVSTLGASAGRERTDVYSAGIANLLRAMDGGWVRRLAAISAAPVGPREQQPAVFRLLIAPILDRLFGGAYADMRRMEHELEQRSDVEWTCLRPPRLVTRPAAGYRLDRKPLPRTRTLTYPDLAAALLDCVDGAEPRTGMLYVAG